MSEKIFSKFTICVIWSLICVISAFSQEKEEIRYLEEEKAYLVTLTRKAESKENLPISVTVITKEQIVKSGADNVGDVLRNKTGITEVSKRGTIGSESEIRIRSGGDSAKQVLVMVDGRPVNNTALGAANLSEIPAENIERIEIMRGPSSALYGANALGGVVNIITKKATEAKPQTEIRLNYGNFGTALNQASFSVKPGKANIFLSGNRNFAGGFRENSRYTATNLSSKFSYDFEKYGELTLTNGFLNSEMGIPGPNYTPIEEFNNAQERQTSSPNANQTDRKFYGQLEHNLKMKNMNLKIKSYGDYQKRRYQDTDAYTDTISELENIGLDSQIETVGNFIFGFEGRLEKFKRTDSSVETINKYRQNYAFFAQKILELNKLSLTPGVRYDYNSTYRNITNLRISTVYKISKTIKVSANIGSAFRAPTFEDLYSPYLSWPASIWGNGGDTRGNENVKPEQSIGTDLGIEFKPEEMLILRVTLFYTDIKDLIEWKNVSTNPRYDQWRPSNVGQAFSRGMEIEIENKLINNLSQNFNYIFLESKGKQNGGTRETLQYTPKHRLNYQLDYSLPAKIKSEIVLDYNHKIEKPKLPSYTLVNLRISRKIFRSEIFINIENIFDKRYVSREGYPLPGRYFSAGIIFRL